MKKKTVGILLGMTMLAVSMAGCGKNEATEAANESVQTEKEGSGEDGETETEEEASEEETEETDSEEEADSKEEEQTADSEEEAEESDEDSGTGEKVAVLLPDENTEQWETDGEALKEELDSAGYEAVVEYADGDASKQVSQIQEILEEEEAEALIIAPVDPYGLADILSQVKEGGIPVFSYDTLIMDTDAVNYYAAFDMRKAGQMIGQEIVNRKDLEKVQEEKQTCSIEFFMGSTDDTAALFFYNGVMEVLQPYLDDGTLVCQSGQMTFDETGILRFSSERAKIRLAGILEEFYQNDAPDIICTGFDEAALSVQEALEEADILPGSEEWPLITGVGCEAEAVKNIAEGRISCSLFMEREVLAEECVKLVDAYLKGDSPEVNDYEQYDNGKKIIGTYACEPHLIDRDNYELLIDNGYYEAEEVQPEALPTNTPVPAEEEEDSKETAASTPKEEEKEATPTPEEEEKEATPTPKEEEEVTPTPDENTRAL